MSGRTVLRARDEGGYFGLMQLGREIIQSPGIICTSDFSWTSERRILGFGESTDGTAHRKITYESHHITLAVPSYELGVDDSDKSTWTNRIRFVEVEPALDHTAKTQFEGSKNLASKHPHRKVHVFSSAKNNIYFINFGRELSKSKSINLSEIFEIA